MTGARVPWIVGVSGASGTPYAAAVLRGLFDAGCAVDLVVSRAARLTILDETGRPFRDAHWRSDLAAWLGTAGGVGGAGRTGTAGGVGGAGRTGTAGGVGGAGRTGTAGGVGGAGTAEGDGASLGGADVRYWPAGDLAAGPSSGSYPAHGMIVVPASTAACAGIAAGLSKDLLQRAAEVALKERRRVVVVPRETPVSRSHLGHLIELIDGGAVVLPASPGFYAAGASASAAQLVDFVAGKILDACGVPHTLFARWAGGLHPPKP
jgi:4-hydroxy-3-polyprenylbenzoate decarboxylase